MEKEEIIAILRDEGRIEAEGIGICRRRENAHQEGEDTDKIRGAMKADLTAIKDMASARDTMSKATVARLQVHKA